MARHGSGSCPFFDSASPAALAAFVAGANAYLVHHQLYVWVGRRWLLVDEVAVDGPDVFVVLVGAGRVRLVDFPVDGLGAAFTAAEAAGYVGG